ncbi:GAF domain-containing protein [Pseudanabaena sp. ABRG5-3]|uniref:GAF domain-containing protein n=1 Tax=Pseudanabaena sp. ABRG5-3 TaxID=685565 RepID=UPI000DC70F6E|nr:GAF domain-containing protein [Pseudanabaena sp. ABRG5-3]BBC25681.1 PAS domain S-box protein [Pseudanabaena sp. ABRG5-3]
MNLKTISSQESLLLNNLEAVSFQSNLEEHTLLTVAQIALQIQTTLLKSSISYAQSVSGSLILKTTLKTTLETLTKYTGADEGSIFLIDEDGVIIESILARGPVTRDLKDSVISKVLDSGLAGWSLRYRQIGLIYDAITDDRWVQLPNQPYKARSALAVPLIYGVNIIGIITLTHSQANHFDEAIAAMMQYSMESIAAIILNAQLHAEYRPLGA